MNNFSLYLDVYNKVMSDGHYLKGFGYFDESTYDYDFHGIEDSSALISEEVFAGYRGGICGFAVAVERENDRVGEESENRLQGIATIYCDDVSTFMQ